MDTPDSAPLEPLEYDPDCDDVFPWGYDSEKVHEYYENVRIEKAEKEKGV